MEESIHLRRSVPLGLEFTRLHAQPGAAENEFDDAAEWTG